MQMLEKIMDFFLANPRRMSAFGELLISLSTWLGTAGLLGAVVTTAVGAMHSLAPQVQHPSAQSLADIYPALPTGWVPESAAGVFITLAIFILGLWLKQTGRQVERLIGY